MTRFIRSLGVLLLVGGTVSPTLAVERVSSEIVRALGTTRGRSVSTGLVFIDGQYLRAPYRVTRAGNQILINDRPATGPLVSWKRFLESQPPSKLKMLQVEEPTAPAEDGIDPAAPKDGGEPPKRDSKSDSSLDDLFSGARATIIERTLAAEADDLEDFKPEDAPADEEKSESDGKSAAAGEPEEDLDPASPEGEAAAKAAAAKAAAKAAETKPAVRVRTTAALGGSFEMNFQAKRLLKPIEDRRMQMEKVLRRGGFLFVGTGRRSYLKGAMSDAVWTKELLKKLPELMERAKDSESFCDDVRSAGLFSYINLQIAQDLYRHRRAYYDLIQRRKAIAEEEKFRKMIDNVR